MRIIKVGSRESRLAIVQAGLVVNAIRRFHPEVRTELVTMKTSGDKILDQSLEAIGGKGLFCKELDEALRERRVDICVHSYKDVPVPDCADLPVVAVSRREDPRDVLVLPDGAGTMPPGRPIGTSSPRRRHQMRILFPDVRTEPVRGNIATRLRKLDSGEYAALVLAAAGIKRLGLWERVHRVFGVDEVIPAACQGMLAVQGRADEDYSYLSGVGDEDALVASRAERAFIEALGATCASPVGAYAEAVGDELRLTGFFVEAGGTVLQGSLTGAREEAAGLGADLAHRLKNGMSHE